MKRILVNASNLYGLGSSGIGSSLLPELVRAMPRDRFILSLPDTPAYRELEFPPHVRLIFSKNRAGAGKDLARLKELTVSLPKIARQEQVDLCLTLGDMNPMNMPCPLVLFVQQALLVYPRRELDSSASWGWFRDLFVRHYFARTLGRGSRLAVQTPVMRERLGDRFTIDKSRIHVISQPVPAYADRCVGSDVRFLPISESRKRTKLLFLASAYPHKNHGILPGVAEELRHRGLSKEVQIFVTIETESSGSSPLLKRLAGYPDVITNLGLLPSCDVAAALSASTALFLPTLAESYGLIYLEALSYGVPVLTSDRDFARWMCRDLAKYFDPADPKSIVDVIEELRESPIDRASFREKATERMGELPQGWPEVAGRFANLLQEAMRS